MIAVVEVSTRPYLSLLLLQVLVTGMMLIHITVLSSRRVQATIISFIPEKISYHLLSGTKYQYYSNAQLLDTTACILLQ